MIFKAVVLAAGQSSRMGRDKALLKIGSELSIELITKKLLSVCREVIVVLGDNYVQVSQKAELKKSGIKCVFNPHHSSGGMLSSVRCGFAHCKGSCAVILQMVDQPFVSPDTYKKLVNSYDDEHLFFQPVGLKNGRDKKGHPILFHPNFFRVLFAEANAKTFRDVFIPIKNRGKYFHTQDRGIIQNLNNPRLFEEGLKLHLSKQK